MIIIGHSAIRHEQFIKIKSIADIERTHQDCIVWFDSALLKQRGFEIATHCNDNEVSYAVLIHSIEELLLYAALCPKYIILGKDEQPKAKSYQALVEHYLLDCKLLCVIKSNAQLTKVAQLGIDGVIFKQVLDSIPLC